MTYCIVIDDVKLVLILLIICVCVSGRLDLPLWPSDEHTRPPCAVERDALSGRDLTQPERVRLPKNQS